jgi:uncharacterized repeat protein (TIGR02543 family)
MLSLLPVSALAADGFIKYPVEGGSIYFDTTTGMVMGADRSVTAANIPAQIGGVAVTGIYKYAFRGWKNLTTVTLPETITVIGETAFMDCSALHSINLPDGLTKVSDNMFYNCTSLREIVLPDSITTIGGWAFKGCTALERINIPDGVDWIGSFAFEGCSNLTEITLPKGIVSIENFTFKDCASLRTITIYTDIVINGGQWVSGLSHIGRQAFSGCDALTDVYFSDSQANYNKILIRDGNDALSNAKFYFNYGKGSSTVTPETPGEVEVVLPGPAEKDEYTVTFDPNGRDVQNLPAEITVKAGAMVQKPEDPSRSGYIFAGWYASGQYRGAPYFDAVGKSEPVTLDMRLYAKWKAPVRLKLSDVTSFVNSSKDYFGFVSNILENYKYPMDDRYRDLAVEIFSASYVWADPQNTSKALESAKSDVNSRMEAAWRGSCFGASTIVDHGLASLFTPGDVQEGAASVYQLKAPKNNKELRSLLHFYQITQYTPEMLAIMNGTNIAENDYWDRLVYALQTNDLPVLVGFNWWKNAGDLMGGHAVLAYDCVFVPAENQQPAYYAVKIWDSRDSAEVNITSPRTLKLYPQKKDGSGALGPDAEFDREYDDAPNFSELLCYLPIKDLSRWNAPDMLKYKENPGAFSSTNPDDAGRPNVIIVHPTLSTNYGSFSIACSDGSSAVVEDGRRVSGTLDISRGVSFGLPTDIEDCRPAYTFTLPNQGANVSYTITPAEEDAGIAQYQTALSCHTDGGYFSSTSASAAGTITITGTGTTTTAFLSAVEQEVTVVRNGAGTPWFNNTVSAVSAGLTAAPLSDGTVRFTSTDGAGLTLSVSDFDTETVFDPVTPDSSGVRITQQGENTAALLDGKGGVIASKSTASAGVPDTPDTTDTPDTPEGTLPFTDVKSGQWFYDAVAYVSGEGLMTGITADTFAPNGTTTRGMIVTILHRLEGSPAAESAGFTDVPGNQWYTKAVNWAAANDIVSGYGDDLFGPNDPITREQMAAILYRYAAYKGYDVSARADLSAFTDLPQASAYAVAPLQWAKALGLVGGKTADTLVPKGSATRAEVATILMRFRQTLEK